MANMEINQTDAWVILGMSSICDQEGIGPDDTDLIRRIKKEFPDLIDSDGYIKSEPPSSITHREHICQTCGWKFVGADDRFCPKCHAREHAGSPLDVVPT